MKHSDSFWYSSKPDDFFYVLKLLWFNNQDTQEGWFQTSQTIFTGLKGVHNTIFVDRSLLRANVANFFGLVFRLKLEVSWYSLSLQTLVLNVMLTYRSTYSIPAFFVATNFCNLYTLTLYWMKYNKRLQWIHIRDINFANLAIFKCCFKVIL